MNSSPANHQDEIQFRADFDFIRYGNCWEDADILIEALRPGPGRRVLSIASAGDNVLALLATGAEVVAADLSAAQLACLELRCAAFRELEHEQLLAFLGVTDSDQRLHTYHRIQHRLSDTTQAFWRSRHQSVADGIVHTGKFEHYFRTFRTRVLPLIHSPKTVAELFQAKALAERQEFFEDAWNNRRWRMLIRVFFSRFLMARMGRDREFFRYVEGSIAQHVEERSRHAMTALPPEQNPYLQYIATGNFRTALPRYLRAENHALIRDGLERLTLYQGRIEDAAAKYGQQGFDGFNLSDIFEYISEECSANLYGELLKHANAGARLAYWNTFVPRRCPPQFLTRVDPQTQISADLFALDKAFFYGHFQVDQVGV